MKKTIVTLAMFIACQGIFAQSIDDLFNHFKNKEGVEYVNIPPLMLKLGRLFMDKDGTDFRFMKGINSVQVLDIEGCSSATRKELQQKVNELERNGYETLIQTKEKGNVVKMFAKMNDDAINELIIFFNDNGECGLTQLKGKIKKDDINVMINEDKIMIDGRK